MSHTARYVCALLLSFPAVSPAHAATITNAQNDLCVVSIEGEIQPGDFDTFLQVAKAHFPGNDGESTHRDTVCLDSPGGNLAEGVKFARHFYKEGVGTVVAADQECYSACAIMFMMGKAEGDEVTFINRKLHIRGKLGFHRPFLDIESDEKVPANLLPLFYDGALQSALDLIEVANSRAPWSNQPMMKSDLIQSMLAHVGDDMLVIDTVDKAGRWDIELVGVTPHKYLSEEQAYYACQNALQWQTELTRESITYKPVIGAQYDYEIVVRPIKADKGVAFEVMGNNSGYTVAGCIISFWDASVMGCGLDDTTGVILGKGECDRSNYAGRSYALNQLAVFDPATKIVSLNEARQPVRTVRCVILREFKIQDDERCVVSKGIPTSRQITVTNFVWPSGSKTVLVVLINDQLEINGVATSRQTGVRDFGACYFNTETMNDFCISD